MLQSLQKYQDPPLYLFEDFFGPIIGESRAIIIQCCFNQEHPDLLFEKDMIVTSVNGCHSPDEFLRKLTAMADASIAALFDTLQHLPANTWPTHLEYVNTKLREIESIVEDEYIIMNTRIGQLSQRVRFKSFTNCFLEGLDEDISMRFGQCIRVSAAKYAEVWLHVIAESIGRIDLKYNLLSKEAKSELVVAYPDKTPEYKLNLTVPQIGCLLNLFVNSGTIDLPGRHITGFIKWVTANFQSKNRANIQPSSLRNKFSTLDLAALDFWEDTFKGWIKKIQEHRDKLTR